LRSDDGSRITIDGDIAVEDWGLHGARDKTGTVILSKGYHDVKIEFFQAGGGASIVVKYKGSDTAGNGKLLLGYHDPNA
jgi:hypothetical protein